MTSDEIRAAIDRLKAIPCDDTPAVYSVAGAFMDMDMNGSYSAIGLRNRLIGLLEQADPDKYMRLPVDADGVPIHIGDRMEDNERVARIVLTDDSWEPSVYLEKLPSVLHEYSCHEVHHYHKPTVEDVLTEFSEHVLGSGHQWGIEASETIAEYADRLRELMQDE